MHNNEQDFYDENGRLKHGYAGALALGHRPYSDFENNYIIENFNKITITQIAKDLGRPRPSLCTRITKLRKKGLITDNRPWLCKRFSRDEDRFIKGNKERLTVDQVAKLLNRTPASISYRISILGISYIKIGDDSPRAKLTSHEVDLIRELIDEGLTYSDIARKFDVSESLVRHIRDWKRRIYTDSNDYEQALSRQHSAIDNQN